MTIKDVFERDVDVGDYILYPSHNRYRPIKVGKVLEINGNKVRNGYEYRVRLSSTEIKDVEPKITTISNIRGIVKFLDVPQKFKDIL